MHCYLWTLIFMFIYVLTIYFVLKFKTISNFQEIYYSIIILLLFLNQRRNIFTQMLKFWKKKILLKISVLNPQFIVYDKLETGKPPNLSRQNFENYWHWLKDLWRIYFALSSIYRRLMTSAIFCRICLFFYINYLKLYQLFIIRINLNKSLKNKQIEISILV